MRSTIGRLSLISRGAPVLGIVRVGLRVVAFVAESRALLEHHLRRALPEGESVRARSTGCAHVLSVALHDFTRDRASDAAVGGL